jgi:hypothetical protein
VVIDAMDEYQKHRPATVDKVFEQVMSYGQGKRFDRLQDQ